MRPEPDCPSIAGAQPAINPYATKLDKTLKRELEVEGKLYTVSISPEGIKIVPKGGRKGTEITWQTILSGDAELRRDLNVSVDAYRM